MNWLIVTPEKLVELQEINLRFSDRKCTPAKTNEGVLVTNADKLQDSYWESYHQFLSSLTPFKGTPVWPATSVEVEETNTQYEQ
jgi:hypothetical protein